MHVTLRTQIVNLIWLHLLDDMEQVAGVGQVAIMQHKIALADVWVLVQVVDAVRVEEGAAPPDAVNLISFAQKEFREVGPILPCNAGY
jgi:hypothetical protein